MNESHESFNTGFLEFLSRATSPFHAVRCLAQQLHGAGFEALLEEQHWDIQPGGAYYLTRNDSSIVAFRVGSESTPDEGVRMMGAHTDSPCLMLKPNPEQSRKGLQQLGVQVYGGALLNPWFDRDLSLSGRVSFSDGEGQLRKQLVDFREPIAMVPSLAIHLDREANTQRSINAQTDIVPILGQGEKLELRGLLAQQLRREYAGLDVAEVHDFELCFYDTQAPAVIGLNREFLVSARLDNLLSCYAGVQALLSADPRHSSLLVCNDHEEVGSLSAAGAQGPMLRVVLERLAGSAQRYAALVENSLLVSCDNAHAIHPNFAARHDEHHGPSMNAGPVIKVNANQRYATTSETSALFKTLCKECEIPVQSFVVRSDMGCGSTIGPITSGGTGVRTLDVGAPQLGMHSLREMTGSLDAWHLSQVLSRFASYAGPLRATMAHGSSQ